MSRAEALMVQPDGKLVAAGIAGPPREGTDFALARYQTDGSLDSRFGDGGVVTTDVADDDFGRALALQPDGKLVVAGASSPPGGTVRDFSLARYNSDGSLDTSFGTDGKVTTDVLGVDSAGELVVQPDGKLVVAGSALYLSPAGDLAEDWILARYNSDGSLDTTFGVGGKVTTDIGTYDSLGGSLCRPTASSSPALPGLAPVTSEVSVSSVSTRTGRSTRASAPAGASPPASPATQEPSSSTWWSTTTAG